MQRIRPALLASTILCIAFGSLSSNAAYGRDPIYVDQQASGSNSGLTWADAFKDLQSALSIAQSGDQIWVAQGVYTPSVNPDPNRYYSAGVGCPIISECPCQPDDGESERGRS